MRSQGNRPQRKPLCFIETHCGARHHDNRSKQIGITTESARSSDGESKSRRGTQSLASSSSSSSSSEDDGLIACCEKDKTYVSETVARVDGNRMNEGRECPSRESRVGLERTLFFNFGFDAAASSSSSLLASSPLLLAPVDLRFESERPAREGVEAPVAAPLEEEEPRPCLDATSWMSAGGGRSRD